jgi:hypothetical protein
MWGDFLFDPSTPRRGSNSVVDGSVADGEFSSLTLLTGEQIDLRLSPFPVVAEDLQQPWRQRHVAVLSAFPLPDMNHHSLARMREVVQKPISSPSRTAATASSVERVEGKA